MGQLRVELMGNVECGMLTDFVRCAPSGYKTENLPNLLPISAGEYGMLISFTAWNGIKSFTMQQPSPEKFLVTLLERPL